MKHKYLRINLFLLLIFAFSMTYGQKSNSYWTKTTKSNVVQSRLLQQKSKPIEASYYQLDLEALKSDLKSVPQRDSGMRSNTLIDFPSADDKMQTYRVMEYSTMHPELQAQYPEIRSYVGYNLEDTSTVLYFSMSPDGLHTMTMSVEKVPEFINPYNADDVYEVFSRRNVPMTQDFECNVIEDDYSKALLNDTVTAARNANDGQRRTFRLAVGTSLDYTDYHGGTTASALAAINTTMTRVNAIYDRELSIKMELVSNNNLLISANETSIFDNDDNLSPVTGKINTIIGAGAYDIGHTFTTSGGGVAYLGSVCRSNKGGGTTGLPEPVGDPFAIDFVSHEMGHQFGAKHTFNGNGSGGNCSSGNRSAAAAYEPGSGSTIMGYAGICGSQNVVPNTSDYFHQKSLQEIWRNITIGTSTCAVLTPTGNAAPTANAGASYNIPISTPYKLSGSSTDADGTVFHTYTWEQFDLGPIGNPLETTEYGPVVRSFPGTQNPVRYIPRLQDFMNNGGTSTKWEKLSAVGRSLNFVLTVRDNDPRGGQTAVDQMVATTIPSAGPFKVTSQASAVIWGIGEKKIVAWDVANTNVAPVNTTKVNIRLSIDGGLTFPITLASNVANNGNYEVIVPNGTVTAKARVMVEGADNIFYNVNTVDFEIIEANYLLNFLSDEVTVCQPNNAVYNFTYNTYSGYNQNTTFSATNLPSGVVATFNPTTAIANGTSVLMTLSGIVNVVPGTYEVSANGNSGAFIKTSNVILNVYNNSISPTILVSPPAGVQAINPEVTFTWEDNSNTENYLVEVSTNSNFSNIVVSASVGDLTYTTNLPEGKTYYWRVIGSNLCATAAASAVRNFSTYKVACDNIFTAIDTPIAIPSTVDNEMYNSVIAVSPNFPIVDVNVKVNLTHQWARDIRLVLISPTGTTVILTENNGDNNGQNFTNTVFDQEATNSITNAIAPFTGSFIPKQDLSAIYGEMSAGNWTLEITDFYKTDAGSLEDFSLEFCFAEPLSIDGNSFEPFSIFPNPNAGEFTVKLQSRSGEPIKIDVYDIRGRRVFDYRFENTSNFREVIRLNNAQAGMYLITISDGFHTETKRVLVN